jgi:hypothetical protein
MICITCIRANIALIHHVETHSYASCIYTHHAYTHITHVHTSCIHTHHAHIHSFKHPNKSRKESCIPSEHIHTCIHTYTASRGHTETWTRQAWRVSFVRNQVHMWIMTRPLRKCRNLRPRCRRSCRYVFVNWYICAYGSATD